MDKITRRNLLGKILIGGLAGGLGLASLVGCEDKGVVKKEEFTLYVTEGRSPTYCGMPNKETFSLSTNAFWAVNYYYPKDAKQINFYGKNYEVVSVDPNKITLRRIELE